MNTNVVMDANKVFSLMLGAGWSKVDDRTLQTQGTKRVFRMVFEKTCVRIDVMSTADGWLRIGGAFYNNIKLHSDRKLQIGVDFFEVKNAV